MALRPLVALLTLGACGPGDAGQLDSGPSYAGVETRVLDADLVSVLVAMRGIDDAAPLEAYARCAAAQHALSRGYGFARHVRTLVEDGAGIWRADAVYTISPALPQGLRTIDAEVTVASCELNGIPTV